MSRRITIEHAGKEYSGEVMEIESTSLGYEDHGILTAYLSCTGNGTGVVIGGFALDRAVRGDGKTSREGTAYGLDHIIQIMRTVGVSRWEELPGKRVVVLFEDANAWGGKARGIANLVDDKVLILAEHAEQWKTSHPTGDPS